MNTMPAFKARSRRTVVGGSVALIGLSAPTRWLLQSDTFPCAILVYELDAGGFERVAHSQIIRGGH
jgi:hypothetical protein